ncbi:hypothetical protein OLMES_0472 [Oleiphilus messinensis]|uniref:Uncharacterized protein n=1 Tax=Oleiphilus messinensis TaxID=141451 RepID=A0A1Y0I464_9GAMM|nr:hypothetical protein OLMES_0472 [Oleiphilus messinensis]
MGEVFASDLEKENLLPLENFHSQLATDFHWLNETVLDCNNAYNCDIIPHVLPCWLSHY